MSNYKKFFKEGINIKDNKLNFDYSNKDGIRVAFGTKNIPYTPYKTKIKDINILSLYKVTPDNKNILRILKGENPDITVSTPDIDYFAKRSALYAFQNIQEDIDLILYNENSYNLFNKFIQDLHAKFSSKVLKVSQSIYKTNTKNLKLKQNIPDNIKDDLNYLLNKLKEKETIKLRNDIPGKFRQYFTGFISIHDDVQKQISGKNILVLDDILTTGSSFSELFDILKLRNATNIQGLSIFKFYHK